MRLSTYQKNDQARHNTAPPQAGPTGPAGLEMCRSQVGNSCIFSGADLLQGLLDNRSLHITSITFSSLNKASHRMIGSSRQKLPEDHSARNNRHCIKKEQTASASAHRDCDVCSVYGPRSRNANAQLKPAEQKCYVCPSVGACSANANQHIPTTWSGFSMIMRFGLCPMDWRRLGVTSVDSCAKSRPWHA